MFKHAAPAVPTTQAERWQAIARRVEDRVLEVIGTPHGFRYVEARPVYEDHGILRLRVNVLVDATKREDRIESTKISRSFFVHAGMRGDVVSSQPELKH